MQTKNGEFRGLYEPISKHNRTHVKKWKDFGANFSFATKSWGQVFGNERGRVNNHPWSKRNTNLVEQLHEPNIEDKKSY